MIRLLAFTFLATLLVLYAPVVAVVVGLVLLARTWK